MTVVAGRAAQPRCDSRPSFPIAAAAERVPLRRDTDLLYFVDGPSDPPNC